MSEQPDDEARPAQATDDEMGTGHSRQAETIRRVVAPWLGGADSVVYGLVGVVFLLGALVMLGYTIWAFIDHIGEDFPQPVITLINDLLLVMIIMEVLRTVLSYIEERGASLRPFLFIGAISATRRILAIGAETTLSGEQGISQEQFNRRMIDLGVNAAVILAIAVALFLITRRDKA
jgi:uncharacterized membrane protein (DUF373 family)